MMRVDITPSVAVRFRGLDCSSTFATLSDAMWLVLFEVARKAAMVSAEIAGMAMALQGIKLVLTSSAEAMSITCIAGATFWSTEALAMTYGGKRSALIMPSMAQVAKDEDMQEVMQVPTPMPTPAVLKPIAPRLPRLNTKISVPVMTSPETPCAKEEENVKTQSVTKTQQPQQQQRHIQQTQHQAQPAPSLPPLRRRIMEQFHLTPPGVNRVANEHRRRGDQGLFQSKIRVGKAWLDPVAAQGGRMNTRRRRVDMYMVRVDCGKEDDKHMNPVVMWDVTANYDEFRKLEKELRQEVRAKKLRNIHVPHLSSHALLFVQEELNEDVLYSRRMRLQAFIDAISKDAVLADLMATRKFFQVY